MSSAPSASLRPSHHSRAGASHPILVVGIGHVGVAVVHRLHALGLPVRALLTPAEQLRQANELGFVARLAQRMQGSTTYSASLGFRREVPEVSVTSNLQGLAMNLPSPLDKGAESLQPLRYENALTRESLATGNWNWKCTSSDGCAVTELARLIISPAVRLPPSGHAARVIRAGRD